MTQFLFREDAYLMQAPAQVIAVAAEGIILDRTVFYATSGGQPGDTGTIAAQDGRVWPVTGAIHSEGDKTAIVHVLGGESAPPRVGDTVALSVDRERRLRLMRMHTALHLLSVALPYAVTGGSVGPDKGRLDFDMPEAPDDVAAVEERLNRWVREDHPVTSLWISDADLAARPDLVKTMKVKPPSGQGRVRLVRIGSEPAPIDLQPCGGTHVATTGEIGPLRIGKIEKKGKQNRRVNLFFATEAQD